MLGPEHDEISVQDASQWRPIPAGQLQGARTAQQCSIWRPTLLFSLNVHSSCRDEDDPGLSWTLLSHNYRGLAEPSEQWPRVKCVRHCCAQSACASVLPEEERSLARPWAAVAPWSFAFVLLLCWFFSPDGLLCFFLTYLWPTPNLVKP